jgi:hypothetical protein
MHLPDQCNSLPIALGQGAGGARMALPFKSRAEHQNKKTTIQVIFLIWRARPEKARWAFLVSLLGRAKCFSSFASIMIVRNRSASNNKSPTGFASTGAQSAHLLSTPAHFARSGARCGECTHGTPVQIRSGASN